MLRRKYGADMLEKVPSPDDFRDEIAAMIDRAAKQGRPHVEINAGELHRKLGGYPQKHNKYHHIPSCCEAMRAEFRRGNAEVIYETKSRWAASFTVRYNIPR
jgi:hypothetical protein